jgi:lipoyl(octanoyl) transferase
MRHFTDLRDHGSDDELWLLEHPRVFTLGQAGRTEHLLDAGGIPVIHSDRGGQVTYHGPGQLVAYALVDLRRCQLGVRHLVDGLEQCIIDMLAAAGITGQRRNRAPGVYVAGRKVCALGLRIRNGCSYHGLALNVDVDLEPFQRIDPCGYRGLEVTRLKDLGIPWDVDSAGKRLVATFARQFGYQANLFAGPARPWR